MNAIWQQARANLFTRATQSVLVLITVIGAATLLTMGLTTIAGAQQPFEQTFNATNGAHIWVILTGSADEIATAVDALATLPSVTAVSDVRQSQRGELFFHETHESVFLRSITTEVPDVARPIVTDGRYFEPTDTNVILLDKNFANKHAIAIGDQVDYRTLIGRKTLTVIGLTINTEQAQYGTGLSALHFVPAEQFATYLIGTDQTYVDVGLRLNDEDAVYPTWLAVQERLNEVAFNYNDWRDVRDTTTNLIQINILFLFAFGFFALIASGAIIGATVNGAILSQYRTIGVLKALGFTGRQITQIYIFEYVAIGFMGSLAGLLIGHLLSPYVLQPITDALNSGVTLRPSLAISGAVVGLMMLFSAIFSFMPARRAGQIAPVQAMRFGNDKTQLQPSRLAEWGKRRRAPITFILGAKEAFVQPRRAILTILNICLAIITIVFALGLIVTLDRFVNDPTLLGISYDATLQREEQLSHAEALSLFDDDPDVTASYAEVWNQVNVKEIETVVMGGFVTGDIEQFDFELVEGRMVKAPNEMVAGAALLRMLEKSVGDTILFGTVGGPLELTVVGSTLYQAPDNTNRTFLAQLEAYQVIDANIHPTSYYITVDAQTETQTVVSQLETASEGFLLGEVVDTTPPSEIFLLRPIMASLSFILAIIALVSVFNSTLMRVRERTREFAILRSMGLTPAQVERLVLVTTIILGSIATLLAVPLGVAASYGSFVGLARMMNFSRTIPFVVNWSGLLLLPFAVAIIVWLGTIVPARWASRISVIGLLQND